MDSTNGTVGTIMITLLLSIIGSGAVFGFIQFLISRHDSKQDKLADVKQSISDIQSELTKLNSRLQVDIEEVYERVNSVHAYMDRLQAVNARVRILRASDEIRHGVKHSKEYFDQICDDITLYENYCRNNKDFKEFS